MCVCYQCHFFVVNVTDGEDYGIPATSILTFTYSEQRQCYDIIIIDDDIVEELNEFFNVELLPSQRINPRYTLADNGTTTATVYIEDNDGKHETL